MNKLPYAVRICVVLIISLMALSFLPDVTIGAWSFRKIDPLSNVRRAVQDSVVARVMDSVYMKQDSVIQLVTDRCRPGITCIEDYSGDSTALAYFFESLRGLPKSTIPVRVAFFGDSFIEGDVFCGSFRDTLQSAYGGRGVGFVPITSDVSEFRNTIKHAFENWRTFSLIAKKDSSVAIGPAGFTFIPANGNWVEYKPSRQRFLREFYTFRLYYSSLKETEANIVVNDSLPLHEVLPKKNKISEWKYSGSAYKSIRLSLANDSIRLYGASFESSNGVYVDNFSVRGNSGMSLMSIPDSMFRQFNQHRDYKLIILQYGLNMVMEDSLNYKAYTKRMVRVVNKLKQDFPKASFLLISVSDRSSNRDGTLKTMSAIPAMRNAQRAIAEQTGIAFWDMYEAMGGENAMVRFASASPPMAAKDFTHLNFKGGKIIAHRLAESLFFEEEKYWKRKPTKKKK